MLIAPFVALLRAAGLSVHPARVRLAARALALIGLHDRAAVRSALAGCLLERGDGRALFDAAFDAWWAAPDRALAELLARLPPVASRVPPARRVPRRLIEAIRPPHAVPTRPAEPQTLRAGASAEEALQQQRFDDLSAAEWQALQRQALALARRLLRPPARAPRLRWRGAPQGRLDWAGSLRALQQGRPRWCWQQPRPPARQRQLLIDVSGSMEGGTRALLLLAHALTRLGGPRWQVGVFATRLHWITPLLARESDPDRALAAVARALPDWGGGTRAAAALAEAAQRARGRRMHTWLVSDGLDGSPPEAAPLARTLSQLTQGGSRLLWLDPLERQPGEPQSPLAAALLAQASERVQLRDWAALSGLS